MKEKIISTPENLQVLYEDNHLIVINKRVGDIVQGDKTGDEPLSDVVKAYLKEKYQKPGEVFLGVVHRLDRPTTGIVVFARTSKALGRLNELFKSRETSKVYWAIVQKAPIAPAARLEHWLLRKPKLNRSFAHTNEVPDSKRAILSYNILKTLQNYYLLEIALETGRHHQIRAQLSALGCPIKGDLKYGFPRSNPDGGIMLHARKLSFVHPVRKELISFEAPLPSNALWDACL